MAHPILMPRPGQMTEECVLLAWHKREGDPVHRGDVLFEIETDKSVMDVESFEEGVLLRRLVEEGQTVPVNTLCAWVGQPDETIPETPTPSAAAVPAAVAPPATGAPPAEPRMGEGPPAGAGRARSAAAPAPASRAAERGQRLRISPRASRLAAEAGIDARTIAGSGPGGRITERDVRAAIEGGGAAGTPAAETAVAPAAAPAVAPSPAASAGEEPPRPLSRMRRVIADRLTLSHTTIPTFTVTVAVDVTALMALRAELKAAGTELTVNDFVLAATSQGLVEIPDVNARTDGASVWPRRRVQLGIAVALPAGLVVPVIRDADRLSVRGIHDRAAELIRMAREGTLTIDDMTGSTFTVSNLGMFGVDEFAAIINPGESAILAVASAIPTPVVVGEGIAVRQVMKLTLTADHRLVDGEMGARFLNAIRRRLEDVVGLRAIL
jgi:pyruvate dehydrogenase E2 component (dihydrolipoamide acetyltransferase)